MQDYFVQKHGELYAEQQSLTELAAEFGTPAYVYSRAALEQHWKAFDDAFKAYPHLVCYAVKANSNLAVLNVLARLGSGFDIVSAGKQVEIFDAYWDKYHDDFVTMKQTEGRINPKMWGNEPPKTKKKK